MCELCLKTFLLIYLLLNTKGRREKWSLINHGRLPSLVAALGFPFSQAWMKKGEGVCMGVLILTDNEDRGHH
jgi:hypothetical protein